MLRDGQLLGVITETMYSDVLPAEGRYEYRMQQIDMMGDEYTGGGASVVYDHTPPTFSDPVASGDPVPYDADQYDPYHFINTSNPAIVVASTHDNVDGGDNASVNGGEFFKVSGDSGSINSGALRLCIIRLRRGMVRMVSFVICRHRRFIFAWTVDLWGTDSG